MEIIIDDREHKVYSYSSGYDNVSSKRLTVGDFLIGYRTLDGTFCPLVIVERKTWMDLAASLKDGRTNNIEKLCEYRDKTGSKIAYLIEGSTPSNPASSEFSNVPYKNLRSHLDHLLFKEGIIELHTSGPRDSLRRLLEFSFNLEKYILKDEDKKIYDGVELATKKKELSDDQISDKIWASIKGISHVSSRSFRPYKICQLFKIGKPVLTQDLLAAIEINGRKFGLARAAALLKSTEDNNFLKTVLAAVPKMGKKRIDIVISSVGTHDFFENWDVIKKKLGIGSSCISSIEKYLFIDPQSQKEAELHAE